MTDSNTSIAEDDAALTTALSDLAITVVVAPSPDVVAPSPVVVAPSPVVVAPSPVVVAPSPDVVAPSPDVVAPCPVVVAPSPVVGGAPSQVDRPGHVGPNGLFYPENVSTQEFRALSQTVGRSPNVVRGCDATYEDQVAAHRVPNVVMAIAYNASPGQPAVQRAIMEHGHSRDNIRYSVNNDAHSAREHRLETDNYLAQDVRAQTSAVEASLSSLHDASPAAAARTMAHMWHRGSGFAEVVAGLDMRSFNSPAERSSIRAARNEVASSSGAGSGSRGAGSGSRAAPSSSGGSRSSGSSSSSSGRSSGGGGGGRSSGGSSGGGGGGGRSSGGGGRR